MHETGKTKDAGYQMGVRKTFDIKPHKAWNLLFSEQGLNTWLDKIDPSEFKIQNQINTGNILIQPTTIRSESHVRMQWQRPEWTNTSILQLRVIPVKEKTIISFHQEKLLNIDQRNDMLANWKNVLKNLEKIFQSLNT